MKIQIVDLASGRLVGEFLINLAGQNYTPIDQEYFNEAWKCAIDDNLVSPERRAEYHFSIVA